MSETETPAVGALARAEALAAGDPDWMNVTRWPRTPAPVSPPAGEDVERVAREVQQGLALDPGCHEDMGADPCGKPPVAARIDPGQGMAYPVCVEHVRDEMVPLAALAACPVEAQEVERVRDVLRETVERENHKSRRLASAIVERDKARAVLAALTSGDAVQEWAGVLAKHAHDVTTYDAWSIDGCQGCDWTPPENGYRWSAFWQHQAEALRAYLTGGAS